MLIFFLLFGLGNSFSQNGKLQKLNKKYVTTHMDTSSLTIIFSHRCGYSLLLNKFLQEEKVCKKYQLSLIIYDVTYLDLPALNKEEDQWNQYPECSNTKVLEKGSFQFAKLRPILFYKNRKGKVKKIKGYKKGKLVRFLQASL